MLETLSLRNLGPAPELDFEFGERLNLITGDNGLGKTFILDVAWWALTRCWAEGRQIHPASGVNEASVTFHVHGKGGPTTEVSIRNYRRDQLEWSSPPPGRPPSPGLVIYARIDGGFSLWDPERNGGVKPEAFQFSKKQLWEGMRDEKDTVICRGLLEDWETWSLKANGAFATLREVLAELSPGGHEIPLVPGPSVRVPGMGVRDVPTLEMPYGPVPLPQTSAGMRRILSLAYMLVWAWTEHRAAAALKNTESSRRIVLLWDEVEAHLHPQWQRTILPAVVRVLNQMLASAGQPQVQVLATTHAPFVLASVETLFDESQDRLFNLELTANREVRLEKVQWARYGSIVEWLRSPAFDMKSGYSKDAELALIAANRWLRGQQDGLNQEAVQAELERTLPGGDPFWPRWLAATGGVR